MSIFREWWFWVWAVGSIYVFGFAMVLIFHMALLHMVTFPLALARAAAWPIFWATGWPHGTPLPMD